MSAKIDRHYEHSCRPDPAEGVCRSRGGESCAFDGAMIVLGCIADAAHLVHGPIACLGNSWESRGTVSDKGILHKRAYATDLAELDVVYGATEKLAAAIRATAHDSGAKAVFVYSTCVTGLIGEDIDGVCRTAGEELGIPVIPVHAPGFTGPKNLGNRIAGEVLIDHVIGTSEPDCTTGTDVNLIGEYNIAGDMALVAPVLARAGINVLARITGNASYTEVTRAHRAKLNLVVCGRALVNVAKDMDWKYGIPYVEVSFFGKTEMARTLRNVASALKAQGADISLRVESVIADEEDRLVDTLAPYASLRGKKAVLYTGGVKSWSFISALGDLGIEVVAAGAKKSTAEDEEKMRALLGADVPVVEKITPKEISRLMRELNADMLIAGGRNQYLAIKEGWPFVDVNQERHSAYAGYGGLFNLARDIYSAVEFYSREKKGARPRITRRQDAVSIDPLKQSASIGAAMAMQGVDNSITVLHGAQGCNFLGKVLLTKQFREPISMLSTKLFVEDVVMESEARLTGTLDETIKKNAPDVIGVVTTGLTEVKGDDVSRAIAGLDSGGTALVHVPAPDYDGGVEEGYATAVERLAGLAVKGERVPWLVNVIPNQSLTPADVAWLKDVVAEFGLAPIVLPDISALDGSRQGFSPMACGGVKLEEIRKMGSAAVTLVVGKGMERAGRALEDNCGVPYILLDTLAGIAATDRLFDTLAGASGLATPARYLRERAVLVDGMRDAMAVVAGMKVAFAGETAAAVSFTRLLGEMAARVPFAVVPTMHPGVEEIAAEEVAVGDFGCIKGWFDLLIANSHGRMSAKRLNVPLLEWGFPVFGRLGHSNSLNVGYRGSLELVNRIGNAMMEV